MKGDQNIDKYSLYDLYDKKERLTKDEVNYILENSYVKKSIGKYFIWKQHRKNGLYIGFAIDHNPSQSRKSAMCRSIDVINERKLCDIELLELAQNFGGCNRKYQHWDYDFIERLIEDDKKYDIQTPTKFVDYCKQLGYSNPDYTLDDNKNTQLKLSLVS